MDATTHPLFTSHLSPLSRNTILVWTLTYCLTHPQEVSPDGWRYYFGRLPRGATVEKTAPK